jgi:secreted trypsin-like serine protease
LPALRALFPYQVGIFVVNHKHPVCGGAVLTENYIITAAHCVYKLSRGSYYVLLGDYDFIDQFDGQKRFEIAEITIPLHYNFHLDEQPDDIALLRLSTPAVLDNRIGQICLPCQSG